MSALQYLTGKAPSRSQLRLLSNGLAPDSARVYLIKDQKKVLRVSPPEFPNVIREIALKAAQAREVLGPELGRPIPVPLEQWEADGLSCALYEELAPISKNRIVRRIQLRRITPAVLNWLRNVVDVDRGPCQNAELNLQALAECPYERVGDAARSALTVSRSAPFSLKSAVMHGDLWTGNILFRRPRDRDFVIIDWGGSTINGFPIFDLVKFAEDVKIRPRGLRTELVAHSRILGCELQDTRIYLLAALGYIWRNLGQFPPERFASMAVDNLRTIDAALNG